MNELILEMINLLVETEFQSVFSTKICELQNKLSEDELKLQLDYLRLEYNIYNCAIITGVISISDGLDYNIEIGRKLLRFLYELK